MEERKIDVIVIEEDGTRKRHNITEKEIKEKCAKRYNIFWVDKKGSGKNV